ncbi:MAG: LD-carboxypeptidase [Caulobacteraceae bacterium]
MKRDRPYRIAVVAPSNSFEGQTAAEVEALAQRLYPMGAVELTFATQAYMREGHFAGSDAERAAALVMMANDPSFNAIWFARGGYGSGRLIETVLPDLTKAARAKTWLGYSDGGALLGALYANGFEHVAHGPMPQDILREDGEAAVTRALAWLVKRDAGALEPSVDGKAPTAAFNMAVLSSVIGAPWAPDFTGHVLMLEETGEYMYRIDRFMFHITSDPSVRRARGIRLGRCSDIPPNDPDFVLDEVEVCQHWCAKAGIDYLGRADIGHDADNKVVPFGRKPSLSRGR